LLFGLDTFTPSCDIRNLVCAASIPPKPSHPLAFSHNPSFTLNFDWLLYYLAITKYLFFYFQSFSSLFH
jgi:hypothetical protein